MDEITKNYIKYLEDKIDKCYRTIFLMQQGLDMVHDVVDHVCADTFPMADNLIPPDWTPKRGKPKRDDDSR